MQRTKVLVLGDNAVGKTCLIISHVTKSYPSEYVPTMTYENFTNALYRYDAVVKYRQYAVALWESSADVGDGAAGKTCLLISHVTKSYPNEYVPTMFGVSTCVVMEENRFCMLSYPGTDIVLLCFALDINDSFENIRKRWIRESDDFCPNAPRILVGCKSDLRETRPGVCVSRERIEAMAKDLNLDYYETSALALDGLTDCFENAVLHAIPVINAKKKLKLNRPFFKRKDKYVPVPLVLPPPEKALVIQIEASTFADDWQKMLKDCKFTDVVFLLKEGQQKLAAHTLVLCSASKFFRQILGLPNNIQLSKSGLSERTLLYVEPEPKKFTCASKGVQKMSELHNVPDDEKEIQELKQVAGIFKLSALETICTNIENKEECYNPEIGTNFNVEVGKQMKCLFFNQPSMADVVFRVEDQNIYANKVVLYARCSVMSAMFGGNFLESSGSSLTEVQIPNTNVKCFLALLEYMYTDHTPIEEIDSIGILVLADEYGLSRLVDLCELNITNEVDRCLAENKEKSGIDVIGLLLTAQAYNAVQLSGWCLHYISINYAAFEKRLEFHQLKGDNKQFVEKNQWPPLSYLEELEKYEAEMKELEKQQCSVM